MGSGCEDSWREKNCRDGKFPRSENWRPRNEDDINLPLSEGLRIRDQMLQTLFQRQKMIMFLSKQEAGVSSLPAL